MKKLLSIIAILGAAFAFSTSVSAESYDPYWDISGDWYIDYDGENHNREFRDLEQKDGVVTGKFWYLDGTWKEGGPLEGHVDGNRLYLYYERTTGYYGRFYGIITDSGMGGNFIDSKENDLIWSTKGNPVDIKAPVVILETPKDNYITRETSVRQEWSSEDIDIYKYQYRSCSNNPNEEDCVEIYTVKTTNTYRYVNNNNIIFWWQVRATDETGNTGEWAEARKITIDPDMDGLVGSDDICSDTDYDSPTDGLGTNRWIYTAKGWETQKPKGKGPKDSYTIDQTYGCSCDQILSVFEEKTGEKFEGHHKFGCSKSILEDWIAGEYYIGPTFIEKVEVPSNAINGKSTTSILSTGTDYIFTASGTWQNSNLQTLDAECRLPTNATEWEVSRPRSLRLQVNDVYFLWGDLCSSENTYTAPFTGLGSTVKFRINDGEPPIPNWYWDNKGSLYVDIYEDRWVNLW